MDLSMFTKYVKIAALDKLFGKVHECPECKGILRKCSYCDGSGKLTKRELDNYHDPIQAMLRRYGRKHK